VAHRFSSLEKFDAEVRKSSGVIEQREFRMESMEHNGNVVRGYAAVYDSDSEFMGYYEQIEKGAFDDVMNDDDVMVICADHGCDPTRPGSDHTREHIPVLACGAGIRAGSLGRRDTFADIGQTVAEHMGLSPIDYGTSFLQR